ncbi:MAG: ribosome biogenesis GTPase YlqF [Firmicutes bacterium HGW-Firmicutes-10]|nr:MAG: ribosome biogenesis GTPase YlqF [Firmicutes bacterium HGW-Firmicutes-10]
MTIQWFPGHMTKAKRTISEHLKLVDMVIELRDGRIPMSSANPLLQELIANKPRLIVFTKRDMADESVTKQWIAYFEKDGQTVIFIDSQKDNVKKILLENCLKVMDAKIQRDLRRGIHPRAIRAMIVGIPNVGKSTLINRLAKRKVVDVANRPGVTQSIKWLTVDKRLDVMDTPGILWPRFDDVKIGNRLALTSAIKEQILPIEQVVAFGLEYLLNHYPKILNERYGVSATEFDFDATIEMIGRKFGFIMAENEVDKRRTMAAFMADLRQDNLKSISWERPDEYL